MLSLPVFLLFLVLSKSTSQVTYLCNSNSACGCSTNSALVTKIIGGEDASINTWGWAVSLLINHNELCGGSILSSSWILTAAHCVDGIKPFQVVVSSATNELLGWKQWRYASSVITHSDYDNETLQNDIALIQVSPPLNMTDPGIAKICLPISTTDDYPPINSTLVVIGWGQTKVNGSVSETLQQVTQQRIPYESYTCYYLVSNQSMQFCADVYYDGKGACHGDSGGALMMFTPSKQWVVVGIVSYGYECARAEFATVYTRVTFYLDWIRSMNVTDAITVETMTTTFYLTTLADNISNSTNDSISDYQSIYISFITVPFILLYMFSTL